MTTKPSESKEAHLTLMGLELLSKIYYLYRTAHLYEPNNYLFIQQLQDLLQTLDEILVKEKKAQFQLRATTLLFNKTKLKFSHVNYYLFRFIKDEFTNRQIASLTFYPGVKEKEVIDFILFLKSSPPKKEKSQLKPQAPSAKGKKEKLDKKEKKDVDFQEGDREKGEVARREEEKAKEEEWPNFPHIKIEITAIGELAERKKNATRVYFLSLTHLKEYTSQKKELNPKNLLTTKRMIQTLFDHIIENESFLLGMTSIKNHDEYTLSHSLNVCILALGLGRRLGLERKELVELGISAFFHDVGKLDIPLEILNKPGKLDENERQVIETHPYKGVQKLLQLPHMKGLPLQALHVAMEHHCREDDRGYPRYRGKKNISLFSKIVKIVDYYDAITTSRPYRKKSFTPAEAISLMMDKVGKEFDPVLFKVFASMVTLCPVGTLVLLNTGEIAIVYETKTEPSQFLRPKVKLITDEQGHKIDGPIVDLAEIDEETKAYPRSIVKFLNPEEYGLKVSDYFVAEVRG